MGYDTEHVGEMYAVNVPERQTWDKLTVDEGKEIVSRYRWILDSPLVLLIGIAPAFGAFGNVWSDNVEQYIDDVEHTRCRYFMIASEDDGHTWRAGGAAARKRVGYRGDNDVGRAMDRNSQNVDYYVLSGANHYPIDEYIRHGLVDAMQKGAHHWGLDDTPIGDVVYGRPVGT